MTLKYLLPIACAILLLQGCRCSSGNGPGDAGLSDAGDGGECEWPEPPDCEDVDTEYPAPACSADDWCWVYPTPSGNEYRALWDDGCTLYAGGQDGALATVDLSTGALIGYENIFEDGWIAELDGLEDGRLLILVNYQHSQSLYAWDGTNLTEWPMPESDFDLVLRDIEVDFDGRFFATGYEYYTPTQIWHGFFARWDGAAWERIDTGSEHKFSEMRLEPCGGMYILGGRDNMFDPYMGGCGVFYWDGYTLTREYWREGDWIFDPCDLVDIGVAEDGAAWAAGSADFVIRRRPDGTWEEVDIDLKPPSLPYWSDFQGVAVESEDSVLLSGFKTIYWDGSEWTIVPDVDQIDLASKEACYAGGSFWLSSRLREVKPSNLEVVDIIEYDYFGFNQVWVSPDGSYYALVLDYESNSPYILVSPDGNSWEEMPLPAMSVSWLNAIWGVSDQDMWACGPEGTVMHYNGVEWLLVSIPVSVTMRAIWGSSANDVYLVGSDSTILHWNGVDIQQMTAPVADQWLMDIWGSGADNIFVITGTGGILKYDGLSWNIEMAPTGQDGFTKLVGKGPDELYIAGSGYVWLYDGTGLTELGAGPYGQYDSIAVHPGTGDVYVTGGTAVLGKVLRYTGSQWFVEDSGTYAPLHDIVFSESMGLLAACGLLVKDFD